GVLGAAPPRGLARPAGLALPVPPLRRHDPRPQGRDGAGLSGRPSTRNERKHPAAGRKPDRASGLMARPRGGPASRRRAHGARAKTTARKPDRASRLVARPRRGPAAAGGGAARERESARR